MTLLRWVFTDPTTAETYTFPRNPNGMTSPYLPQVTTPMARTIDGRARAARALAVPVEWSFKGDIRTQAHHDALAAWAAKDHRVHVTDHLARTWEVMLTQFDADEQRPRLSTPWRFTYQMRALIYRRIT